MGALCKYMDFVLAHQYTDQQLGSEIWQIEAGRMSHKGKVAVVEDAFIGLKSPKGSGANTPVRSRTQTPAASVSATPVGSGAEDKGSADSPASLIKKKKKLTRNQMKAQEERRRLRKLHWLTVGGPKPEDTDED